MSAVETVQFDTGTPAVGTAWRFNMEDIQLTSSWLVPRLRERWSRVTDTSFVGWMRSFMADNQFSFMRTENAVGLAQLINDPMSPDLIVDEIFVWTTPGHEKEGGAIYDHWKRWGIGVRAVEFRFGYDTDVPIPVIRAVVGGKRTRTIQYVNLAGMS